jgi:hypothetical protein
MCSPFRLLQFARPVRYLLYNNNSPCRAGCMVMTEWHEKGVILFGEIMAYVTVRMRRSLLARQAKPSQAKTSQAHRALQLFTACDSGRLCRFAVGIREVT